MNGWWISPPEQVCSMLWAIGISLTFIIGPISYRGSKYSTFIKSWLGQLNVSTFMTKSAPWCVFSRWIIPKIYFIFKFWDQLTVGDIKTDPDSKIEKRKYLGHENPFQDFFDGMPLSLEDFFDQFAARTITKRNLNGQLYRLIHWDNDMHQK